MLSDDDVKILKECSESSLKKRIIALITKMQTVYNADVFGFSRILWEDNPKTFISVSNNWDEVFRLIRINVNTQINIKNSAALSQVVQAGS